VPTITTKGKEIYYKDWGGAGQSFINCVLVSTKSPKCKAPGIAPSSNINAASAMVSP